MRAPEESEAEPAGFVLLKSEKLEVRCVRYETYWTFSSREEVTPWGYECKPVIRGSDLRVHRYVFARTFREIIDCKQTATHRVCIHPLSERLFLASDADGVIYIAKDDVAVPISDELIRLISGDLVFLDRAAIWTGERSWLHWTLDQHADRLIKSEVKRPSEIAQALEFERQLRGSRDGSNEGLALMYKTWKDCFTGQYQDRRIVAAMLARDIAYMPNMEFIDEMSDGVMVRVLTFIQNVFNVMSDKSPALYRTARTVSETLSSSQLAQVYILTRLHKNSLSALGYVLKLIDKYTYVAFHLELWRMGLDEYLPPADGPYHWPFSDEMLWKDAIEVELFDRLSTCREGA